MQTEEQSDLELMRIHFRNEYKINDLGRVTGVNHWSGGRSAGLLFGRTKNSNHWHFGHHISPEIRSELNLSCRQESLGTDKPLRFKEHYASVLGQALGHYDIYDSWVFCKKNPPAELEAEATIVEISPHNQSVLEENFSAMLGFSGKAIATDTPIFAKLIDNKAVSLCNSARISELGAECYISTAPEYRNQGYATKITKHWANTVYASQKIPFLNTTLDNKATIAIANGIGFDLVGRVLRIL